MQKLLLLACLFLFLACKKEPKEPLLPTRDLSWKEVFDFLHLDCPAHSSSANYFQGTLNGQSFCRYEGDIDFFRCSQNQPALVDHFNESADTLRYTDLHIRFVPRGPAEVGTFSLKLSYRDTTPVFTSLRKLLTRVFKEGEYLPLSTFNIIDAQLHFPTPASTHGVAIELEAAGWPYLDRQLSSYFYTDDIRQPADRYVKCTRMRQTDNRYEIELEVNLQIDSGTEEPADLKGIFHFDMML